MKKIAIVCDSSVSLTEQEIKDLGIYIAPLTIIHNGNEYLDQITITSQKVNDLIRQNQILTTSQPNLGYMIELFEDLKTKNYDAIFALPVARHLSGTHRTFEQAKNEVQLDNMIIIDTGTLVTPIQRMLKTIMSMNEEGQSIQDIETKINDMANQTESLVLPKDLKQLKASGRISTAAATMASLLRIKPILKLETKAETIDKFATARTEAKAFELMIDDLALHNVHPDTHYVDYLHCEEHEILGRFIQALEERLGNFDSHIADLPSSLATHAGIGTIAVQWVKK